MKQIKRWAKRLSKTRKELNDIPSCPYAESSLKSGKSIIVESRGVDAILIKGDLRKDWVFMYSTPGVKTRVAGKTLPHYGDNLTLIQRKIPLLAARKKLHATGYYKNWNKSDYERIVGIAKP